jgi:bifunctional non-homologous end joining protein LigD
MTTGSRGLHVVAPLQRRADYEEVHAFGRAVADRLASEHPDRLTSEFRREKRGDRIYLDMNRNAYGQHAIAAYSPRALPNAPVATPLEWDELDDPKLDPQGWSITTVLERLADRGGDPWAGIAGDARALGGPRKALG